MYNTAMFQTARYVPLPCFAAFLRNNLPVRINAVHQIDEDDLSLCVRGRKML